MWCGIVELHPQILVDVSSADRHRSRTIIKDAFVVLAQPFYDTIYYFAAAVAYFAVIDMETDSHLLSFDCLVGDARVVRVQFESDLDQTLSKLLIVK